MQAQPGTPAPAAATWSPLAPTHKPGPVVVFGWAPEVEDVLTGLASALAGTTATGVLPIHGAGAEVITGISVGAALLAQFFQRMWPSRG